MLTNSEIRMLSSDVDKLARITNGYISEGAKYEEITTDEWFDHEVQSITDRYPEGNLDKTVVSERVKKIVKGLMNQHLYD